MSSNNGYLNSKALLSIVFVAMSLPLNLAAQEVCENPNKCLYNEIQLSNGTLSKGESLLELAKHFIGTPYVAGLLDQTQNEELLIELHQTDCMLFVEHILAMYVAKRYQMSYAGFVSIVQSLRYRNGTINGYCSRLHYATEWGRSVVQQGYVKDVTKELGGVPDTSLINFMSNNYDKYPHLANSPENVALIRGIEQNINRIPRYIIPAQNITEQFCAQNILPGDIIMLATNIKGLDYAHFAFACTLPDGRIGMLHASSTHKQVVIGTLSLTEYLKRNKLKGITILRP